VDDNGDEAAGVHEGDEPDAEVQLGEPRQLNGLHQEDHGDAEVVGDVREEAQETAEELFLGMGIARRVVVGSCQARGEEAEDQEEKEEKPGRDRDEDDVVETLGRVGI